MTIKQLRVSFYIQHTTHTHTHAQAILYDTKLPLQKLTGKFQNTHAAKRFRALENNKSKLTSVDCDKDCMEFFLF